jgi:rhodanese-related sulfurtransferase
MNYRRIIGLLLVIGAVLSISLVSCNPVNTSEVNNGGGEEFEIIRQAADAYVNSAGKLNVTAKELYDTMYTLIKANVNLPASVNEYQIEWYDAISYTKGPIIIDERGIDTEMPDAYTSGHIPGAFTIPWRFIADSSNLMKLRKERQVVVYSSTGQTGAQAAAILGVLGYDAVNLMWGITSWTADSETAPGRYVEARDTVWNWGDSFRAVCPISEPVETYAYPVVENTTSTDKFEIIRAAALAYLRSNKPENMAAQEFYHALHYEEISIPDQYYYFTNPEKPDENPYTVPFILDLRDDETYQNGHICGAAHIFWKNVFKPGNLNRLPPGKQILVYSDTGHESGMVAALLNLLGYDAINLKWGIAGWSLSFPGKDIAPARFVQERDCMDYPVLKGYQSFLACPT